MVEIQLYTWYFVKDFFSTFCCWRNTTSAGNEMRDKRKYSFSHWKSNTLYQTIPSYIPIHIRRLLGEQQF